MKIKYTSSVKTVAGWRSVTITAIADKISPAMVVVRTVELINGEKPDYGQSRTGAKRQEFNGRYFAAQQVGAKKRISTCDVIES